MELAPQVFESSSQAPAFMQQVGKDTGQLQGRGGILGPFSVGETPGVP